MCHFHYRLVVVGSGVAAEATVASRSSGDRSTLVFGWTPVHGAKSHHFN